MFFIVECFYMFSQHLSESLYVMMLNVNLKLTAVMLITKKYYYTLIR